MAKKCHKEAFATDAVATLRSCTSSNNRLEFKLLELKFRADEYSELQMVQDVSTGTPAVAVTFRVAPVVE